MIVIEALNSLVLNSLFFKALDVGFLCDFKDRGSVGEEIFHPLFT